MGKSDNFADRLEKRARTAIFWNALTRVESALIIAGTMIITACLVMGVVAGLLSSWLPALIAVGVGVVLELAIFVSSLTDAEDNARVVAGMLREQYNPMRLRTPALRAELDKALQYQGLIANAIGRTKENVLRDRLLRATEPVNDWIEAVYRLATRLDSYQNNQVLQQDQRSVPPAIENLKKRLAQASDPAVQDTLRNTIADKQRQLEQLSGLRTTMEKAGLQLESTLAALGTIYAQLQALDVREAEGDHAERLRQEIGEQVAQLQDLSDAMDEVYAEKMTK